jgi:hypothetical protein
MDKDRDGFVLARCRSINSEEYEHAIAREQLFTAKLVVVVCLLMLTILQHHIQMVWVQKM